MSVARTGSWSCPFLLDRCRHAPSTPRDDIGGAAREVNPRTTPATVFCCGRRSAAGAAELAARVVELAVDLVLQEHDGRDHGERDECHEEDVLHHRSAT